VGGAAEITLDNATLRFVVASDGRGEGLGGIDLQAADRDEILAAAKGASLDVNGDSINICGTRFRLL